VNKVFPELETHNVFLADDYQTSFDDIFKRQQIPKEPSFYVNVPSRVDSSAAPPGRDTIVILVPCGHLRERKEDDGLHPQNVQDWQSMVSKARNAVFETIHLRTGADIRPFVVNEIVNTPASWKEKFNLDKGAILGLSHSFFNVLSFRPGTRHGEIKNLYFVGASTHPGTGVPIVLAGSKITTGQILRDLRMSTPWPRGGHQRKTVSNLDRWDKPTWDMTSVIVFLLGLVTALVFYCSTSDPLH